MTKRHLRRPDDESTHYETKDGRFVLKRGDSPSTWYLTDSEEEATLKGRSRVTQWESVREANEEVDQILRLEAEARRGPTAVEAILDKAPPGSLASIRFVLEAFRDGRLDNADTISAIEEVLR